MSTKILPNLYKKGHWTIKWETSEKLTNTANEMLNCPMPNGWLAGWVLNPKKSMMAAETKPTTTAAK